MDEEVEDLLLSPFGDILEKAREAIDNADAGSHADMSRAAQGLVKQAERARKTLEPVARRHLGLYGVNFVTALKDHDGIAEHLFTLNELVYGFDDYTSPDTFDADKFRQLDELTKHTTLCIVPLLRRMKLEPPARTMTPVLSLQSPAIPFAPGPGSVGSRTDSFGGRSSAGYFDQAAIAKYPGPDGSGSEHYYQSEQNGDQPASRRNTMDTFDAKRPPYADEVPEMGAQSGPDLGYNGGRPQRATPRLSVAQPVLSLTSAPSSAPSQAPPQVPSPMPPSPVAEPAPPEPSTNPWQLGARPVDTIPEGEEGETAGGSRGWPMADSSLPLLVVERRRRVATRPDSPTLPGLSSSAQSPKSPLASSPPLPPPLPPPKGVPPLAPYPVKSDVQLLDDAVDVWQAQLDDAERLYSASAQTSPQTVTLHLKSGAVSPQMRPRHPQSAYMPLSVFPPGAKRQSRNSAATTASTANGSIFSISLDEPASRQRESGMEPLSPPPPISATSPVSPTAPSPSPSCILSQPGLEAIPPVVDIESGLIPVETPRSDRAPAEALVLPVPADCNIGPNSSFHLLKGFCEGAKEVQRGNIGVRRVQKLSMSGAGNYAAKCVHCLYELQWSEVDRDRKNDSNANYRMNDIQFRLRFLSKSHLPAKQIDAPQYACLFCLAEGQTMEQSDATVFFSQAQLFRHLARHPRPLPRVAGVTVIDGPERPPQYRDNYDLHFTLPPTKSELDGIRPELSQLPTGTAIETFRKLHGSLRRAPDDLWPLQFPAGAKIVGIEFPVRYKGEWGVGWFDNVRAPFPAEVVRLDPPTKGEIRTQGTSSMRAVTRWKWATGSAYRNSEWLRLDKNEVITNVAYASPAHWCWAGTNSRGKWGYFPQSHVEPNSLKEVKEASGSDRGSVSSREKISALSSSAGAMGNGNGSGSGSGSGSGGGGGGGGGFMSRFRGHNSLGAGGSSGTPSLRRPVSVASSSTASSR